MSEDVNIENINFSQHDLNGEEQYDDLELDVSTASNPIQAIRNKNEFYSYLKNSNSKPIHCVVLHHTYSPRYCNGISTMNAIRNYHMSHGWSEIAANGYATNEEDILMYSARPLTYRNGAHAYIDKPWSQIPADLKNRANGNRQYLNTYGYGIETFGAFDTMDPKTSTAMEHAIQMIVVLCDFYNLNPEKDIYFHRDVAAKSCPGNLVTKEYIISEVKKEMGNENCENLPAKNYQKEALQWAKDTGLLVGDNEGNQMPQCNITRGDMMVVLKRFKEMFIDKQ